MTDERTDRLRGTDKGSDRSTETYIRSYSLTDGGTDRLRDKGSNRSTDRHTDEGTDGLRGTDKGSNR